MSQQVVTPSRPSRKILLGLFGVALFVLVLDQVTKYLAIKHLDGKEPVEVLGQFLQLRLLFNPGAALSIASGQTWIITLVVIGFLIFAAKYSTRLGSKAWAIAFGLLLGGGIANLLDRLFRSPGFARGHVVDFIDYNGWFVGNVADIAIVVAGGIAVLMIFLSINFDGTKTLATGKPAQPSTKADQDA